MHQSQNILEHFASVGQDHSVSYPLCYVHCIFNRLKHREVLIPKILEFMQKAEASVGVQNSGVDWEATVQIAIILGMLHSAWYGAAGPFNISPTNISNLKVDWRTLPDYIVTVADASAAIQDIIRDIAVPTLMFIDNSNALFEEVEGYVAYTTGNPETAKLVGFQAKRGSKTASKPMSKSLVSEGAVLLRGKPNGAVAWAGWQYYTKLQIFALIGTSLRFETS